MWSVIKPLGLILLGVVLKQLLDPVLGPVLGPALPTVGGFIQSTMTRTNEAAFTIAIRYTAAGYREPGDVLLAGVPVVMVVGLMIVGAVSIHRAPRPISNRALLITLSIVAALGLLVLLYVFMMEVQARTAAMQMYKLYERKIAVLAPYLSPQEARELGSSWARMNSRADLKAMDERFLALFQQHGLTSSGAPAAKPE